MKLKDRFFVFLVLLFLASLYLFFSKTTYDQVDISDALNKAKANLKVNQEIIVFESKNPFNFYDIFNNLEIITNQHVYGVLTYPDSVQEKYPVIIGVAGSKGWGEHHYGYMDRYQDAGFATLNLHSFKSRGVESTVGEQISATIPMIVHDAYMALAALSEKKEIDINKVAITGWSLGGGVALLSAWKPIQEHISPEFTFAAHLPIYPPCMSSVEDLEFTSSPIYILIGEIDNWVPAEPCIDLVKSMQIKGYDVGITVYPDAHHSFDRNMELKSVDEAYSLTDCRLSLSKTGIVKTLDYNIPFNNSTLQKIGLYLCADRGTTFGGHEIAREKSKEFALKFMTSHLLK